MNKIIKTGFLLLILALDVPAVDFFYRGKEPVEKNIYENRFNKLIRNNVKLAEGLDSLSAWLANDGYLDNRVNLDGEGVLVTADRRYLLEKLVIVGDTGYEYSSGGFFIQAVFERAVENVLKYYYHQGYYYARANIAKVAFDDNRVQVILNINKGPSVTVSRNDYTGLKHVPPEFVSRYLPLCEGDTLREELIRQAEKTAAEIPFITFLPPVSILPEPGFDRAAVRFDFLEPGQFRFVGGGGYLPDDPTGLVWNINLTLRHLFGPGRQVAVNSERREKGRNILDITYQQPFFILGVDYAEFSLKTRDYRDQFYEFAMKTSYKTRIQPGLQAGLSLGWKRVEPATGAGGYTRFSSGFTLERHLLDDRFNPPGGYTLDWTIGYAYRRYSSDTLREIKTLAYNDAHTELSFNFYQLLIKPLVMHLGLNYNGLESGETLLPLAELYFIGGPGTLRSFRNEQFAAQRAAFGTVEPRFRFQRGYLFIFYDAAYINYKRTGQAKAIALEELYRWGYGLGLALSDRKRSVKLSLGWNEELKFNQPRLSIELSADL